ncbi:hypothetical protein [Pseudostreptobacillus hongkongensis]|uniref:hypothetical protein n=1 Tax=Pseudostreptobacillus hongkongensis TaxID=1162717 RepID=UPI00082EBB4E|nr:hypothetical protein [Pseudostreptobacillus hongkongensis]
MIETEVIKTVLQYGFLGIIGWYFIQQNKELFHMFTKQLEKTTDILRGQSELIKELKLSIDTNILSCNLTNDNLELICIERINLIIFRLMFRVNDYIANNNIEKRIDTIKFELQEYINNEVLEYKELLEKITQKHLVVLLSENLENELDNTLKEYYNLFDNLIINNRVNDYIESRRENKNIGDRVKLRIITKVKETL